MKLPVFLDLSVIRFLIVLASVFLLASHFTDALANQDGIPGYSGNLNTNGGMNCNSSQCHSGGLSPNVKIEGPNSVLPNSLNKYKITMNSMTSRSSNVGGIGISVRAEINNAGVATDGELLLQHSEVTTKPTVAGLKVNEIVHKSSQPVLIDGSMVTWYFDWKAPATLGNVSIYVSALAADNDLTSSTGLPVLPDKATPKGDRATTNVFIVEVVDKIAITQFVKPVAIISAPLTVVTGDKVQLIASNSFAPVGIITQYKWSIKEQLDSSANFPQYTEILGEQIEYVFKGTGQASVFLTVTSDQIINNRNVDNYSFLDIQLVSSNTSSDIIPTSRITGATQTRVGATVDFSGILSSTNSSSNASNTTNSISHYIWDFGDSEISAAESTGSDPNVSHIFTQEGVYWVSLAVQNNGLTHVSRIKVKVVANIADSIISGKEKFNSTCASADCHAVDGLINSTVTPNIKQTRGATFALIKESLLNIPVMKIYASRYTELEIQNMADFLGSGFKLSNKPGNETKDGLELFTVKCEICHGIDAKGLIGRGRAIISESQSRILQAINKQNAEPGLVTIPLMSGITLSGAEAGLIEQFLNIPIQANTTSGTNIFIKECQMCHGSGTGGSAKPVLNMTVARINAALKNILSMQAIKPRLKQPDIQNLENFLLTTGLPTATTGRDLYDMYCSYCHGPRGKGSKIARDITKVIFSGKQILNAYKAKGKIPQMVKTNLKNVTELTPVALNKIGKYLESQIGVK